MVIDHKCFGQFSVFAYLDDFLVIRWLGFLLLLLYYPSCGNSFQFDIEIRLNQSMHTHPLSLPVSVVPVCAWTASHVTSSWLITLCQSMSPVNNLKHLLKSIWKHFWRRFKNPKVTLRIDKNLCSYRLFIEMILIFLKASTWVIKNSHESFK